MYSLSAIALLKLLKYAEQNDAESGIEVELLCLRQSATSYSVTVFMT